MNWYLLNIPLCVAIATALVAPIMIVISREPLGDGSTDHVVLAETSLVPAPERVLERV